MRIIVLLVLLLGHGKLPSVVDPWSALDAGDTGYCVRGAAGWGWNNRLTWPTDSHEIDTSRTFSNWHQAIDILSAVGSPVYAANTGVVIWAGFNVRGYGNLVILAHGNGWRTLYGHLSSVSVQCGQTVGQGHVIGAVGQTGASSFEHLHFEVRQGDYNYDPLKWLADYKASQPDQTDVTYPPSDPPDREGSSKR